MTLTSKFDLERLLSLPMDNGETELISAPDAGSSGSRVFIYKSNENGKSYAVKKHITPRVTPEVEKNRRDHLAEHLGDNRVPRIITTAYKGTTPFTVSEAPSSKSLHSIFSSRGLNMTTQRDIWQSTISRLSDLWSETAEPFNKAQALRNPHERLARIHDGIKSSTVGGVSLKDAMDYKIIFKDEEYPSINEAISCINDIQSPAQGVMCHGDPQPANILVDDDHDWHLVDWEWSGKQHDWRMMVSHMHGWWAYRYFDVLDDTELKIQNKKLIIDDSAAVLQPQTHKIFQNCVRDMYQDIISKGDLSDNPTQDEADINRHLIALYMGDLRFTKIWGREHIGPSLLLESVKLAKDVIEQKVNPENSFMFSSQPSNTPTHKPSFVA